MANEIVPIIEQSNKQIASLDSITEVHLFVNARQAAANHAKKIKDPETAFTASVEYLLGKARGGELLSVLEKGKTGPKLADNVSVNSDYKQALDEARLNERTARRWQQLYRYRKDHDEELIKYFRECNEKGQLPRENFILSLLADKDNNVTGKGTIDLVQSDAMTFLASLDDASIDLLLTDPPYSTDVDDIESFSGWVDIAMKKIKPTGRAYIFIGAYPEELKAYLFRLTPAPLGFTFDNVLVWTYRNTLGPSPTHGYKLNWQACLYLYGPDAAPLNSPSMKEQFSVHDVNAPDARTGARYHAWQKPDELGDMIINHSTNEGDTICDPFAGTGTFLYAARRNNRDAIGCEIDSKMIELIRRRAA